MNIQPDELFELVEFLSGFGLNDIAVRNGRIVFYLDEVLYLNDIKFPVAFTKAPGKCQENVMRVLYSCYCDTVTLYANALKFEGVEDWTEHFDCPMEPRHELLHGGALLIK